MDKNKAESIEIKITGAHESGLWQVGEVIIGENSLPALIEPNFEKMSSDDLEEYREKVEDYLDTLEELLEKVEEEIENRE